MPLKRLDHIAFRVVDIDPVVTFHTSKLGFQIVQEMEMDFGGLKQLFTKPHPVTGVITEIIERYRENIFFVQENVVRLIQSTEGL